MFLLSYSRKGETQADDNAISDTLSEGSASHDCCSQSIDVGPGVKSNSIVHLFASKGAGGLDVSAQGGQKLQIYKQAVRREIVVVRRILPQGLEVGWNRERTWTVPAAFDKA